MANELSNLIGLTDEEIKGILHTLLSSWLDDPNLERVLDLVGNSEQGAVTIVAGTYFSPKTNDIATCVTSVTSTNIEDAKRLANDHSLKQANADFPGGNWELCGQSHIILDDRQFVHLILQRLHGFLKANERG